MKNFNPNYFIKHTHNLHPFSALICKPPLVGATFAMFQEKWNYIAPLQPVPTNVQTVIAECNHVVAMSWGRSNKIGVTRSFHTSTV